MTTSINRRRLLQLSGAAAGALAMPNIVRAQAPTELVLGTNGGIEYETMYRLVYQRFEQENNVTIVPVFGDGATLLARAVAEKDAPTMDVTITYQGAWRVGQAEGVFQKVDYNNIPFIDDVYDSLIDPEGYAPFSNFAAWGISYNADVFGTPPTSLKSLWQPEIASQLMVGGIYHSQIHLAAIAHAFTGDQHNIDAAFEKFKELVPQIPAFYGLSSDAQSKFEQGIGNIATWYSFTTQRVRAMGLPLSFQAPEEGSFLYPASYQAITGTKKLDLVEKLLGALYDPANAEGLAAENGYIPANKKVKLSDEIQKLVLTYDEVMAANNWDWDFINANQGDWLNRWNAEIVPLLKTS